MIPLSRYRSIYLKQLDPRTDFSHLRAYAFSYSFIQVTGGSVKLNSLDAIIFFQYDLQLLEHITGKDSLIWDNTKHPRECFQNFDHWSFTVYSFQKMYRDKGPRNSNQYTVLNYYHSITLRNKKKTGNQEKQEVPKNILKFQEFLFFQEDLRPWSLLCYMHSLHVDFPL